MGTISTENTESEQPTDNFGDTRLLALTIALMIVLAALLHFFNDRTEFKSHILLGIGFFIIFILFFCIPMRLILRNPNMKKFAIGKLKNQLNLLKSCQIQLCHPIKVSPTAPCHTEA